MSEQPTEMLRQISKGDAEAAQRLLPLLYDEFRHLAGSFMRQERSNHTLNPTALVHEAYMKLVNQREVDWQGRTHFFNVGAQAMRRILVDHARQKRRIKRGGGEAVASLDENQVARESREVDLVDLDDAIRHLAELDPRQAEVVELRFFGEMDMQQIADKLGVSKRTVESDWTMARAWLSRELAR